MATASLGLVLRQLRGLTGPLIADTLNDRELLGQFCASRDEAAFAALVRRYGPMVLSVCRRILGQVQDAEDACQATFLLLARKAALIRKGEAVSGWLHAVAVHLALRARGQGSLRRQREQHAAAMRQPKPVVKPAWRELEAVLDDELQKLPPAFRAVLIQCYLEAKTQEEAARQLNCPLGTVRSWLARARQLLRNRLQRRGVMVSAAALATALAASPAAAMPASLVHTTCKAGLAEVAGQTTIAEVSPQTMFLVQEGLKTMARGKLEVGLALGLLAALLGAAVMVVGHGLLPPSAAAGPRDKTVHTTPNSTSKQPALPAAQQPLIIAGRVLAADGKPVAGARVAALAHFRTNPSGDASEDPEKVLGTTRADGNGRFRLPVGRLSPDRLQSLHLLAAAAGHGLGWRAYVPSASASAVDIRLGMEHAAKGRLVDLQGQPAVRVRVHVLYVVNPGSKDSDAVGLWKLRPNLSAWPKTVTTDAQGRFVVHGLGGGQKFGLRIQDDRFARQDLHGLVVDGGKEPTVVLEGPHVVEGRITFADTHKPVPGAKLLVKGLNRQINEPTFEFGSVEACADRLGRFRVNSYPGNTVKVTAFPPGGSAYMGIENYLAWPRGAARQKVNLALPRGVQVRGKVVDTASGKPVAHVRVEYWPQRKDNPFFREEVLTGWGSGRATGADGSFTVTVLPGPGSLLFQSADGTFIQQAIYHHLSTGQVINEPIADPKRNGRLPPDMQMLYVDGWHRLNLKPEVRSAEVKVKLRRGVTVHGRLLDPDGKTVARARMLCRLPVCSLGFITLAPVEIHRGRFTLTGCDPGKVHTVLFLDAEHRWGAVARIAGRRADAKPVTVRLASCGSAELRINNSPGQPAPNYRLNRFSIKILVPAAMPADAKGARPMEAPIESVWLFSMDALHYQDDLRTDAHGKVTLPVLIPGTTYQIWERGFVREFQAQAGKVVKPADITVR